MQNNDDALGPRRITYLPWQPIGRSIQEKLIGDGGNKASSSTFSRPVSLKEKLSTGKQYGRFCRLGHAACTTAISGEKSMNDTIRMGRMWTSPSDRQSETCNGTQTVPQGGGVSATPD